MARRGGAIRGPAGGSTEGSPRTPLSIFKKKSGGGKSALLSTAIYE